jgi:hypothetical protein
VGAEPQQQGQQGQAAAAAAAAAGGGGGALELPTPGPECRLCYRESDTLVGGVVFVLWCHVSQVVVQYGRNLWIGWQ